eukprot:12799236-Alexandrium_andersonii.AAC.1
MSSHSSTTVARRTARTKPSGQGIVSSCGRKNSSRSARVSFRATTATERRAPEERARAWGR